MDLFFDKEFRDLLPPLSTDEKLKLQSDLQKNGNLDPIIIWKEKQTVIDGHNRYDICTAFNIQLKPATELSFPDKSSVKVWMITHQIGKRNLNDYQRSVMALKLEDLLKPVARENLSLGGGDRKSQEYKSPLQISANPIIPKITPINTRQEVAKVAHVSHDTIAKVKIIEAKATPEQKARLVNGGASINQIYNKVKSDSVVDVPPLVTNLEPKNITIIEGDMLDVVPTLGKFDLIIADPPYNVTEFEWDKIGNDFLGITKKWLSVCKAALSDDYHLFWFCSPSYSADIELIFRELNLPIQSRIVWHRRNMAMGSQCKNKFIDTWEMVFHSGNCNLFLSDKWDDARFDVQTFAVPQTNFNDKKLHPTQKPVDLIKWLVKHGAGNNSNILDPFAGSGTTGAACLSTQKCTLIDSNHGYIDIARQRIGIHV